MSESKLPPLIPSPITTSIKTICKVDVKLPADQQPTPVHNRWHPDIPCVATVTPNQTFKVECIDWTGGQILNNDDADDIKNVDLTRVHYLSGPIHVETAMPGDLLVVEICDIHALPGEEWGFTGETDTPSSALYQALFISKRCTLHCHLPNFVQFL